MRLVVESIAVRNFGSWADGRLELGGNGPIAIVGANGSGKSTIVSKALVWCLYGKAAPERMGTSTRALAGRSVVREGESSTAVEIILAAGDRKWRVVRGRKLAGSEAITVERRDGPADWPLVGSDQAAVDALIGAPYDVFCRTVIRGQGDVWSFAEAPDARKREIIDSLSGGELFGEWHQCAKDKRQTVGVHRAILAARLDDAIRRLAEGGARDLPQRVEQWDAAHAFSTRFAQEELAALQAQLDEAVTTTAAAEEARRQRAELMGARPMLDMAPYDAAIRPVEAEWQRLDRERATAQAEHDRLCAISVGSDCPTCGQPVSPAAPIVRKKSEAAHRSADLDQAAHHAQLDLEVARQAKAGAGEWLRASTAAWEAKVAALPPEVRTPLEALERAAQAARRRVEETQAARNPWLEAAAAQRAAQARLEAETEVLKEGVALYERDEADMEVLIEAYSAKGVRASLGVATLAAIESAANRWLTTLSGGSMSIEFDPHRQTQKGDQRIEIATIVRMRTPVGVVERDLLQLSGGQRVRVNFAVDLGVAACFARGGSLALSLLVLDEAVFSNLDEEGKAAMVTAIHHAGVEDVVVIDHDARISGSMPRWKRVEMVDGLSRWADEVGR